MAAVSEREPYEGSLRHELVSKQRAPRDETPPASLCGEAARQAGGGAPVLIGCGASCETPAAEAGHGMAWAGGGGEEGAEGVAWAAKAHGRCLGLRRGRLLWDQLPLSLLLCLVMLLVWVLLVLVDALRVGPAIGRFGVAVIVGRVDIRALRVDVAL